MSIRILLADDHTMVREGLRMILEAQPDMIVVGEAAEGREAVRLTSQLNPDGVPLLFVTIIERLRNGRINQSVAVTRTASKHKDRNRFIIGRRKNSFRFRNKK